MIPDFNCIYVVRCKEQHREEKIEIFLKEERKDIKIKVEYTALSVGSVSSIGGIISLGSVLSIGRSSELGRVSVEIDET